MLRAKPNFFIFQCSSFFLFSFFVFFIFSFLLVFPFCHFFFITKLVCRCCCCCCCCGNRTTQNPRHANYQEKNKIPRSLLNTKQKDTFPPKKHKRTCVGALGELWILREEVELYGSRRAEMDNHKGCSGGDRQAGKEAGHKKRRATHTHNPTHRNDASVAPREPGTLLRWDDVMPQPAPTSTTLLRSQNRTTCGARPWRRRGRRSGRSQR